MTEEHRLIEQLCRDLNQAHDELMKAQGASPEKAANLDWPDWSPQANSIRWAERLLGKPLSKTGLLTTKAAADAAAEEQGDIARRVELVGGGFDSGLTTDPDDPALQKTRPGGQQQKYLVLSDEERAKGFVRPVRTSYVHKCGSVTNVNKVIAETFARDPSFYDGTFCYGCGRHFMLVIDGEPQFHWTDGCAVGS